MASKVRVRTTVSTVNSAQLRALANLNIFAQNKRLYD